MTWLLVALAGGVGSVLRMWIGILVERSIRFRGPLATALINITGSFLLGLLTAFSLERTGLDDLTLILGVGVLGGYTTFSTASVEIADLALAAKPLGGIMAVLYGAAMLVLSTLAGALGLWLF